nr:NB-ARC domain-containing protein [Nitrosomonas nitrosa]
MFTGTVSEVRETGARAGLTRRAPRLLSPLLGRTTALQRLSDAIKNHRIVTIVGAGGIGKTALALSVAGEHPLGENTECVFIDFSTSTSALHVAGRVLDALELEGSPHEAAAHMVNALQRKSMLLIFDNCEDVIEHVATIALALTRGTEQIAVLATSREPLRVTGECLLPLEPLSCSPEGAELTAEMAMSYAAIQMFVEAARLRSNAFTLNDTNASLLGDICRKLDGIPLAIELAAATIDAMTISELAQRLDDRFSVLTRGSRTALPRHRTLQAALDWSYETLTDTEAAVMRRLGVFPAKFTLADAQVVAATASAASSLHGTLAELSAKSLISVDVSEETTSFRLLETMRVYARLKLLESDESSEAHARFVEYTLSRLNDINTAQDPVGAFQRLHSGILDDWRAAHDWVTRTGDWHTALKLMEAGIGFCRSHNIKTEYTERAAATLRITPHDVGDEIASKSEMRVCDQMAQMLVDTQPPDGSPFIERIDAAATRALAAAMRLNATDYQMSALVTLMVGAITAANTERVLNGASQVQEFADRTQDPDFLRTAHYLAGYAGWYSGAFGVAMRDLTKSLVGAVSPKPGAAMAFDHIPCVLMVRSRVLWLRGEFQASLDEIEEAHRLAIEGGDVPTIAWVAWGGGLCVYWWAGDVERGAASAKIHEDLALEYSNPGWARYLPSQREAELRFRRGERSFGVGPIDWVPHVASHADVMTSVHCGFHRPADLQRIEADPRHWCAAEHLRAAGEHHLIAGRTNAAEAYFARALATAKGQGAVAWEIRASLSLARLRIQRNEIAQAREILDPLVERFRDAGVNADIVLAADMLASC